MQSMKRLALVAALCALPGLGRAAFDKGGVLGVGARATGMGSAFVAIADDNTATFWNPAGLVQLPRMELGGFFGPLLNGKEYYMSGAFVMPFVEQTALGFSLVSLYHDTGDPTTDAFENQYIASFATPLNVEKTVSIGVNLKFLQYDSAATATISSTAQTIEAKASTVGMDLGGLYQVLLPSWGKKVNFGFLAQDLDTVLRWQSGVEERVPLLIQAGVAYYPEENLVFSIDYSFFNDTNISGEPLDTPLEDCSQTPCREITTLQPDQSRPHVGLEGWFFNSHLGLRTGYTGFATTADEFTAGVSYKQDWFGVDYGYIGHAEHLGDSHRLSGHMDFGGSAERPRVVALVNPPTNLAARPNNNSVQLQWVPNQDPHVTGYTVYMSKASGSNYVPIQKRINENKVIIDGLTNGQRYYFVVTSVNNSWPAVESNYSTEVSCVPSPQILGAPSLGASEASPVTNNNGTILAKGWPVPVGQVAGYNLYMSDTSGTGYKKVNDTLITAPSLPIHGLEINKRYFFTLTSVTNDNPPVESAHSQEFSFLSQPEAQLPEQAPAPGAAPAAK
jgi:hypothetical protein